jgi:hypothetical protein
MPDNPLSDRGRSLEEDYFRKRDQELIDKMRRAAAADKTRQELSASTGLQDPHLIAEMEALGFRPETVALLPLVPLIEVAWAEGGVSDAERTLVLQLARSRGIIAGSVADRQLADWLDARPSADMFERATRLVRATLSAAAPDEAAITADDLVKYSESIAAASGGIFGMNKISAEERGLLERIAAELKRR